MIMTHKKYAHVIVIGVDGAGAWIKDAVTPQFDRIFADGAVTYKALSSRPTISAECWGSMLIGVGPEVHKLTNEIVSTTPYPTDSAFPSVFKRIRLEKPDAKLGSFCDWDPITYGIVENDLGVIHATDRDTQLTPLICDYIKTEKPDFLFIQFDSVDGAGHANGYGTEAHLKQIGEVDTLIGDVYRSAAEAGILDNTLFIVIADHGGTNPGNSGGSHGGWSDEEKYVTFAATGKTVKPGTVSEMNIRDLAAIILYALDIKQPAFEESGWTSQIPQGLFDDPNLSFYRDISHLTGAAPRISEIPHTSRRIETEDK